LLPLRIRSELFPTSRNHTSRFVWGLHTCDEFALYLAFCSSDSDFFLGASPRESST